VFPYHRMRSALSVTGHGGARRGAEKRPHQGAISENFGGILYL